ncbi:MAG: hypothetical protein QOJ99_849 [Bryobacterales bacterium]|nr:hypothetical protein [Bryobacterales bacterium]
MKNPAGWPNCYKSDTFVFNSIYFHARQAQEYTKRGKSDVENKWRTDSSFGRGGSTGRGAGGRVTAAGISRATPVFACGPETSTGTENARSALPGAVTSQRENICAEGCGTGLLPEHQEGKAAPDTSATHRTGHAVTNNSNPHNDRFPAIFLLSTSLSGAGRMFTDLTLPRPETIARM